jgi:hypothetical protein
MGSFDVKMKSFVEALQFETVLKGLEDRGLNEFGLGA